MTALSLAQGGEFAFVLLSFAVKNRVVPDETAAILVAAVAVSMATTPLIMLIYDRLIRPRLGTREVEGRTEDRIEQGAEVIVAGFGRVGSIVGRFLQSNGVYATYLDLDPDNVDLLRKLGLEVYYGDAGRHDLLAAAGAEKARILVIAVDDAAKALQIVESASKHFPHLKLLVRSIGWGDTYDLLDRGIDDVYRETFDSALRMGSDALTFLGHRRYFSKRAANRFRRHDERFLREMATLRGDEKQFLSRARARLEDLETIMQRENDQGDLNRDDGWDASSLMSHTGNGRKSLAFRRRLQ